MIREITVNLPGVRWPVVLGLFRSVVVTVAYTRTNRTQADLAEQFGVSQPTVSRAIAAITPLLALVLKDWVPTGGDLDPTTQYVVDGTLLPCWSWADTPQLYSGKHHTTGLNVQVACTLSGQLAWVSDPIEGARHDTWCLRQSGVLEAMDPGLPWIGDKGYLGNHMITPIRKPPTRDLLDWEKDHNTAINKIRYIIERTIANLKTWRILHTDYRRPLDAFHETINAVLGLHFYRLAE